MLEKTRRVEAFSARFYATNHAVKVRLHFFCPFFQLDSDKMSSKVSAVDINQANFHQKAAFCYNPLLSGIFCLRLDHLNSETLSDEILTLEGKSRPEPEISSADLVVGLKGYVAAHHVVEEDSHAPDRGFFTVVAV